MTTAKDRIHIRPGSIAPEVLNTPLAAVLRQLEELSVPHRTPTFSRMRQRARIQALRWLEQLDSTQCLDELWPAFEGWLREHPENHHQYLIAERALRVIEDLRRGCPKEGSEAAEQLLRLQVGVAVPRCSSAARAKWWVLTTGAVAGSLVLFWVTHSFG